MALPQKAASLSTKQLCLPLAATHYGGVRARSQQRTRDLKVLTDVKDGAEHEGDVLFAAFRKFAVVRLVSTSGTSKHDEVAIRVIWIVWIFWWNAVWTTVMLWRSKGCELTQWKRDEGSIKRRATHRRAKIMTNFMGKGQSGDLGGHPGIVVDQSDHSCIETLADAPTILSVLFVFLANSTRCLCKYRMNHQKWH